MPRQARLVIPHFPHHVIQRGHNRQVVFAGDDDYLFYLDTLQEWKSRLGCRIYAYCLMTNHVHLVIDPGEDPDNLGRLMKRLAGRQTRYVNRMEQRSGSLWEGRYKSSLIQDDAYLLACCRYVELNPFRAGTVDDPANYRWSSCPAKVGRTAQAWLDLDPFYLNMGHSETERAENYAAWLEETVPEQELQRIREAAQRGQLMASGSFAREPGNSLRNWGGACNREDRDGHEKKYRSKENKSVPFFPSGVRGVQ